MLFSSRTILFVRGKITSPLLPANQDTLSFNAIPDEIASASKITFICLDSVGIKIVPGPNKLNTNTPKYPYFKKGSALNAR